MPPKLATWLLLRLGSGEHLDVIIGDLHERFETHPSRSRYWRQVLHAITLVAVAEVRSHPLMALGTVLLSWLCFGATLELLGFLRSTVLPVVAGGIDVAGYSIALPTSYLTWVWRYDLAVRVGIFAVAGLVTGWMVSRVNAQRSGPMLLFLATFVLLLRLGIWSMIQFGGGPQRPLVVAIIELLIAFTIPLSMICGGILSGGLSRTGVPPLAS